VRRKELLGLVAGGFAWFTLHPNALGASSPRRLTIRGNRFMLDGKSIQLISGEMHYARVPHEYWRHRLRLARAMGLNTVSTYVFWNFHEPRPGSYDFKGRGDVARFIRTAQEEGLHVILRPGPYACAEWDFGGFPSWLLAGDGTVVRSRDECFLVPVHRWLRRLGEELAPLRSTRGGPIVAVQVENEYGSYGTDREYVAEIRDALTAAGFDDVHRYTADGADELPAGTLPDLPCVANFGPGGAGEELAKLQRFRPGQPTMCGEYWCGWFDHWGEEHQKTEPRQQAAELEWMLSRNYSVNLYVFHGGTNFGFSNGANYTREHPYQPTTTSYDYDAPLDEAGRVTAKYRLFAAAIARHTGTRIARFSAAQKRVAIAPFTLDEAASFRQLLGTTHVADEPPRMETNDEDYRYVLYGATIKKGGSGTLAFADVRDYAVVFVDGERVADMDRRLGQRTVELKDLKQNAPIEVLLENTGRINFGKKLASDRKGLFGPVTFAGEGVRTWTMTVVAVNRISSLRFEKKLPDAHAFYRGTFMLTAPHDTFLDTRMLGKGLLWVNGHAIGRFWEIGPQFALYVPGPWLRKGANQVVAFDLASRSVRTMEGRTEPLYAPISE